MIFDRTKSEEIAQELLPKSFKKAARGPDEYDCMGILIYYFSKFGIEIPDYSNIEDWGEYDFKYISAIPRMVRKLEEAEKPRTGDIIIFSRVSEVTGDLNHAGIFLGDSRFLHAAVNIGIKIDATYDIPWKNHIYGYFRLKDDIG